MFSADLFKPDQGLEFHLFTSSNSKVNREPWNSLVPTRSHLIRYVLVSLAPAMVILLGRSRYNASTFFLSLVMSKLRRRFIRYLIATFLGWWPSTSIFSLSISIVKFRLANECGQPDSNLNYELLPRQVDRHTGDY